MKRYKVIKTSMVSINRKFVEITETYEFDTHHEAWEWCVDNVDKNSKCDLYEDDRFISKITTFGSVYIE